MNKCAFCIPIHPKHYEYARNIADSLTDSDADLFFIFTNNSPSYSSHWNIEYL